MANSIADLETLPDIDVLSDEGITYAAIQDEMIADYQDAYESYTGEAVTLYPANPRRLEMNVVAGQIYQMYEFAAYLFKQNFIRYMTDDNLWNWGANLGFSESNLSTATCTLEFGVENALDYDVTIPAGTRATAGDDVYFATSSDATLSAGETTVSVAAVCTESGTVGNDYAVGQITTIVDPVVNISSVTNTTVTSGGADEYTGDDLREKVYLFPSTYSVAGPMDAYIYYTKLYSTDIISVAVITTDEAVVDIYVMLKDGEVPDETYCEGVLAYLEDLKRFPDTDMVEVLPPEIVEYELTATYYISTASTDTESTIKASVEDAANAYIETQYENLGYDINPDIFVGYARAAGAKRVVIDSPTFTQLAQNQIAICTEISLTYGGLEDD